jgi:hypothetical protein
MKMNSITLILFQALLVMNLTAADTRQLVQTFINNPVDPLLATQQIKSGTRYVLLTRQIWQQLSGTEQQVYLQRASLQPIRQRTMLSPSGKFTLHWDDSGINAVPAEDAGANGVPDFIDSALVIFDRVWQFEIDALGFQAPPGEDGNPVSTYHIYFSDLPYYGLTYYSGVDIAALPGENYTSYIEVENDFAGFPTDSLDGLKVTAAHEFNHASQFGYNVRTEDFYFYEMTSTWMEDALYPEINDYYQYLDSFFGSVSNTSFTYYNSYTVYPYANCLYLKMLTEQFDAQIISRIWERLKMENSLAAIAGTVALTPYNTSWLNSLNQYALWLYFTGSRSVSGQYFSEATNFPEVIIKTEDQTVYYRNYSRDIPVSGLANCFLQFYGLSDQEVTFIIETSGIPQAGFLTIRGQQNSGLYPVNSVCTAAAAVADTLILILTNAESGDTTFSVTSKSAYSDQIYYGPNPVNVAAGQRWIEFRNMPAQAEISIFTISGKMVFQGENSEQTVWQWNLKNKRGEAVAAGVYLFVIRGNDLMQTGKIAILR